MASPQDIDRLIELAYVDERSKNYRPDRAVRDAWLAYFSDFTFRELADAIKNHEREQIDNDRTPLAPKVGEIARQLKLAGVWKRQAPLIQPRPTSTPEEQRREAESLYWLTVGPEEKQRFDRESLAPAPGAPTFQQFQASAKLPDGHSDKIDWREWIKGAGLVLHVDHYLADLEIEGS